MNILPKKSWHVLKKENIERVRRDEAKAAEEEKQKLARIALAEQEARTARLRENARKKYDETVKYLGHPGDELAVIPIDDQPKGHINFFKDIQEGKKIGGVNADHEAEKEAEKIKYEKKIGLLTYLGQSSAEAQTVKPWYQEKKRKLTDETDTLTSKARSSVDVKRKTLLDPMEDMNRYLCKKSDGHKGKKMVPDRLKQPSMISVSKAEHPFIRTNDNATISGNHHRKEEKTKRHKKHKKYNCSDDSDSERKHKKNKSKHKKKCKKHHRKHRRQSNSSSSSKSGDSPDGKTEHTPNTNTSIEKLRAERLRREAEEKARTERLLSGNAEETPPSVMSIPERVESTRGRYNSQFHPELARKPHYRKDFHI